MTDTPSDLSSTAVVTTSQPWYYELNRYQWFVLAVCTLGWTFDCLDQQLFNLARQPAITDLLGVAPGSVQVEKYGGYATSILLIGWAIGGVLFGVLGDRLGRARTMVWTILAYSLFAGLSGLAQSYWQFVLCRFMTGLGIGGQFAVGVTLVAETMPDRARPFALGLLQAVASMGNVAAALIAMTFSGLEQNGVVANGWRWMFAVGVFPAMLALVVMRRLQEPVAWQRTTATADGLRAAGSMSELFGNPFWRRRAIIGLLLASSGVMGLWGIGFFSIDLNRTIFRNRAEQRERKAGEAKQDRTLVCWLLESTENFDALREPLRPQDFLGLESRNDDPQVLLATARNLQQRNEPISHDAILAHVNYSAEPSTSQHAETVMRLAAYLGGDTPNGFSYAVHAKRITSRTKRINGEAGWWGGITSMLFNMGAFFGVYTFSRVTARIGRRPTFAFAFLFASVSTACTFLFMKTVTDMLWMVPMMGFFQLSLFGGYAIYFPELFPTRLRSTGTSFCYNIARLTSAGGPLLLGLLTSEVFNHAHGFDEPMRYAGLAMCSVFILGLFALLFAPETQGQPLPE